MRAALVALCLGVAIAVAGETVDFDGPAPRIVNGLSTRAFPETGALLYGANPATAWSHCSGVLIGCETFLTAAHCVELDANPAHYSVFFQHAGHVAVAAIEPHPSYLFPVADVAVLRLAAPVRGIAAAAIDDVGGHAAGTDGTIVGFGRSGGAAFDYGLKRHGAVSIASCLFGVANLTSICWNFEGPIGAPGTDSNTCNADSGGPLFVETAAGPVVAGVTSGGNSVDCLAFDHSFDARVSFYSSFIQTVAGADLGSQDCDSLPRVGDADVETFAFDGSLSGAEPLKLHSFTVEPGALVLRVTHNSIDDGVADFRMYLRHGLPPSLSTYDCAASGRSQYGSCAVDDPSPGTWYAMMTRQAGAGSYQLTATSFGTLCSDPGNQGAACDDGNPCTSGDSCQGGACVGSLLPDGAGCDDGNPCTAADACLSGACGGESTCGDGTIQAGCEQCDDGGTTAGDGCDSSCAVETCWSCDQEPSLCGPPGGCAVAARNVLVVKDGPGTSGDRLVWRWSRGTSATEAFGDPRTDQAYDLCLWQDGELIAKAGVAAGGMCGRRPCWKATGAMFAPDGYRFKDKSAGGDGVFQVVLKRGSGSARVLWKARGDNLSLPGAASPTRYFDGANLRVQALRDDAGACWEASFTPADFKKNTADRAKAVR